jgi:hypothetical protein
MVVADDEEVVDAVIVVIAVDVVGFEPCRGFTSDAVVDVLAPMTGTFHRPLAFTPVEIGGTAAFAVSYPPAVLGLVVFTLAFGATCRGCDATTTRT